MHLSRAASILAIASAMSICACGSSRSRSTTTDTDVTSQEVDRGAGITAADERSGTVVQGVATFSATDVARILLVLEQTSLDQAKLAEGKALTIEVKTYAARMVRERGEAVERLSAILARLTTPRSEDPTPTLFENDALRTRTILGQVERTSFDLPFMTAEMSVHARMLGLLDASLLPSAEHSDDPAAVALEQELLEVRTATASQIVHALRVQGVLRVARASTPPSAPDGVAAADGTATSQ